jgi:polyhydroxyalkanoate synthesis regulator protein
MAMFSPFGGPGKTATKPGEDAKPKPDAAKATAKSDEIDELKTQLAAMQAKLEELSRNRT